MRKRNDDQGNAEGLRLVVTRADLEPELRTQLQEAELLLTAVVRTADDLEALERRYSAWSEYTARLLRSRFTTPEFADKFERKNMAVGVSMQIPHSRSHRLLFHETDRGPSLEDNADDFRGRVKSKQADLKSIIDQLPLIPEPERVDFGESDRGERGDRSRVFVVHGHDDDAKNSVALFLTRIGLEPIILHEQVSGSQTVIEKIESYGGTVGFAVVLLTPDDEGRQRLESEALQPRARQNVIAELGYFVGSLKRERVCILRKGDMELLPSDFSGVVSEPMDKAGAWRSKLANELDEAGFSIDFKKVAKG